MKNRRIHFKAYYAESIERVWKALTDPDSVKDWLTQANFKPKRGHRFQWKEPQDSKTSRESPLEGAACEIQEVEAPYRLRYLVEQTAGPTSIVTWNLESLGEGTQVIIEQELLLHDNAQAKIKLHPSAIALDLYLRNRTLIKLQMELEQTLLNEMEIAA